VSPDKERLIAALGSPGVFTSYPEILDHCCAAWNKLTEQPWRIMSIGLRDWPTGSDQWDLVLVFHRAMPDLRRMKLGYDEGGVGTEVGSSLVLRARVLV
jgi:hypothetical protein